MSSVWHSFSCLLVLYTFAAGAKIHSSPTPPPPPSPDVHDAGVVENSVTALPSTLVEKQWPAWLGIYFRFTVPLQTGSVVTYFASESVFNASTTSTPDILFSATCTASYTSITSTALTLTLKPSPGHVSCSAASHTYISIPQTYLLRNPSAGTQVYVNVATLLPSNQMSSMTAPQYTITSEIHPSPPPLPSPSPDEPGVLNFECSAALPITCGDTVSADLGAAPFMGQNSCAGIKHSGPQLWYAVNAPPGQLVVSTCDGANFDTLLTVMSGQCSDLQCITTNDDSCGMQSRTEVEVTEPTLYFIMVYGYGGLKGMFNMTTSCVSTPPLPSASPLASPEPWNRSHPMNVMSLLNKILLPLPSVLFYAALLSSLVCGILELAHRIQHHMKLSSGARARDNPDLTANTMTTIPKEANSQGADAITDEYSGMMYPNLHGNEAKRIQRKRQLAYWSLASLVAAFVLGFWMSFQDDTINRSFFLVIGILILQKLLYLS